MSPAREERSLFPREHGASMELVFPLLSAFALGAPTLAGIGLAVAAILVFVSHEALLVLLGQRGERQRVVRGPAARRLLAWLVGLAALAGLPALAGLSPTARLACLVPLVLAIPALVIAVRGERQRTLPVELLVALTLSSVTLPVAIDAGLPPARAGLVVLAWTVSFAIGTFAARGVLYRSKDGGHGLARARLVGATGLALSCAAVIVALVSGWSLAWLGLAPLPWALAALALGAFPPSPRRMTAIGFSLVGASSATLALLLLLPW